MKSIKKLFLFLNFFKLLNLLNSSYGFKHRQIINLLFLLNEAQNSVVVFQFDLRENFLHKFLQETLKRSFSLIYLFWSQQLHKQKIFEFDEFCIVLTTKVVVTFYLRLRNEFQPFPTKPQAFNWLTCWISQAWCLAGNGWNSFLNFR